MPSTTDPPTRILEQDKETLKQTHKLLVKIFMDRGHLDDSENKLLRELMYTRMMSCASLDYWQPWINIIPFKEEKNEINK